VRLPVGEQLCQFPYPVCPELVEGPFFPFSAEKEKDSPSTSSGRAGLN
jgi:hypothetical protein